MLSIRVIYAWLMMIITVMFSVKKSLVIYWAVGEVCVCECESDILVKKWTAAVLVTLSIFFHDANRLYSFGNMGRWQTYLHRRRNDFQRGRGRFGALFFIVHHVKHLTAYLLHGVFYFRT